jgi:hypothetical protein
MSTDRPDGTVAPGRSDQPSSSDVPLRDVPLRDVPLRDVSLRAAARRDFSQRSVLALVPWRNFRRVLFLVAALLAVLTLKRSSGGFFKNVFESTAPPAASRPAAAPAPAAAAQTTVHLRSGPGLP